MTGVPLLAVCLVAYPIWSLGYRSGWRASEAQWNVARYTYRDVMVLSRHSERSFTLQPARMQPWETGDLCQGVDWQAHTMMIRLSFSIRKLGQGKTCKDVGPGGDFLFYTHDGQPVVFPYEESLK